MIIISAIHKDASIILFMLLFTAYYIINIGLLLRDRESFRLDIWYGNIVETGFDFNIYFTLQWIFFFLKFWLLGWTQDS